MRAVGNATTADGHLAGGSGGGTVHRTIAIGAALLSLCLVGFIIAVMVTGTNPLQMSSSSSSRAESSRSSGTTSSSTQSWVAAAPGRVEPRSGLIRLGTQQAGQIEAIPVQMNTRVSDGEVLIRLDDKEARARLAAAEAEAATRKRERDAAPATAGRESVSKAEDAVFTAERAVMSARFELDDTIASNRKSGGNANAVTSARKRLTDAKDRLRQEQSAFASAQNRSGVPAPNRLEAALIASRSDVTLAESVLDKTRVRAPIDGTVLQINAKVGELVAPSPDFPLVVMGDMTIVRVRAEVDEADVSKVKRDQRVFVRNTAHPNKDFEGKVVELAPSLAMPRMGSRGARRATDVEVMEVVIELDGSSGSALLPGMRTDVFFRR
jgi:HlyD family secretion protein